MAFHGKMNCILSKVIDFGWDVNHDNIIIQGHP